MATDTERLVIELSANLKNFENNWRRANGLIAKNTKMMEKSFGGAERAAQRAASAIVTAFGVREIVRLTDQYTRFTNQLKIAGFEGGRLAATQEDIFGLAQKYGVALEDLGTLFGRTSQSANELGASQADLRKFVEGTAAAMRVQGGDVGVARGALIQLSQALGGTTVRAEEFNSMQEGLRPLVIAAANGIDRFGGSFSRLRAAVIKGEVSSREFFEGLLKGYDQTIEQAKRAQLTIGQSFQVLANAMSKYLGEANQASGATLVLAEAIKALADNLNVVIPALATITLGLGVGFVRGAIAATAATGGLRVALLGAFGGPVGIAITAVAVSLVAVAGDLLNASHSGDRLARTMEDSAIQIEAAGGNADELRRIMDDLKGSMDSGKSAMSSYRNEVIASAREMFGLADATRAARIEALELQRVELSKQYSEMFRLSPQGLKQEIGTVFSWQRPALEQLGALRRITSGAMAALATGGESDLARYEQMKATLEAMAELDAEIRREFSGAARTSPSGRPPAAVADDDAQKAARLRERLALEGQLAVAEAGRDKATTEALQRQLDILGFQEAFERAKIPNAHARAEALQAELEFALGITRAAEEQAKAEEKIKGLLQEKLEIVTAIAEKDKELLREMALKDKDAYREGSKLAAERTAGMIDYYNERRQGEYDATLSGVSGALRAVADGDALQYLEDRLKQMLLDNLATKITSALLGGGQLSSGSFLDQFLGRSKPAPGYAGGTNYHPGGLAWVGERGRELLHLPRGSRVTPNHRLGGSKASMSLTFAPVVTIGSGGPDDIAAFRDEMRRERGLFASTILTQVPAFLDQHNRYKGG